MKIIPVEKKKKVLAFLRQTPVPSFIEIAKQTGIHRTTIYHWFVRFEHDDLKWSEGGRNSFKHYPREVRQAIVQA
jgi:transposase-like protein